MPKEGIDENGKVIPAPFSSTKPPSSPIVAVGTVSPGSGGIGSQLSFRSRTDSVIEYTPPMVGEAAGSTFYITKAGHIDYVQLLKVTVFLIWILSSYFNIRYLKKLLNND